MQYFISSNDNCELNKIESHFIFDRHNIDKLKELQIRVTNIINAANDYKKDENKKFDNFLKYVENELGFNFNLEYNYMIVFLANIEREIIKAMTIFDMPKINVNEIKLYFPSEILLFEKIAKDYIK